MTIEFCHKCHKTTECRVLRGERLYFEHPYINAYCRTRICDDCGGEFTTYEISQASFSALRQAVSKAMDLAEHVDRTWSSTRDEFHVAGKDEAEPDGETEV